MSQVLHACAQGMPESIGQYRVRGRLGGQGMGEVYLAEDTSIPGRMVAIKTVALDPRTSPQDCEALRNRLEAEAHSLASLKHPGIPTLHHTVLDGGSLYLVMEYIEGQSLFEELRGGEPLQQEEAVRIALGILDALGAAHAKGILHRDIKPGNIMLTPGGEVKLIDFGIAKNPEAGLALTRPDASPGTPAYMAPEQIAGQGCSPASDLFSLGVVLYEMLVGRRPFESTSHVGVGVAFSILSSAPRDIRDHDPAIAPRLAHAVMRALAKAPCDRFASADEMAAELRAALSELVTSPGAERRSPAAKAAPRPPRWVLPAAALAACVGIGAAILALYLAGRGADGQRPTAGADAAAYRPSTRWVTPPTSSGGALPRTPPGGSVPTLRPKDGAEEKEGEAATAGGASAPAAGPTAAAATDSSPDPSKKEEDPLGKGKQPGAPDEPDRKPAATPPITKEEPDKPREPDRKPAKAPVEPRPEPPVLSSVELGKVQSMIRSVLHNDATGTPRQDGAVIRISGWALDEWHKAWVLEHAPKSLQGFPEFQLDYSGIAVSRVDFLKEMLKAIHSEGFTSVHLTPKNDGQRLRVVLESDGAFSYDQRLRVDAIAKRYHPLVDNQLQRE